MGLSSRCVVVGVLESSYSKLYVGYNKLLEY